MNVNVGNDIIEVERIKESIENLGNKFLNRVFTEKEIEYCESKNIMKYQYYAARFAAKEAVFKAISKLLENKFEIGWKDVEILNDINGRPYVNILSKNIETVDIDISISHIKDYAISTAIVVTD